jgi:hypothetical protein
MSLLLHICIVIAPLSIVETISKVREKKLKIELINRKTDELGSEREHRQKEPTLMQVVDA